MRSVFQLFGRPKDGITVDLFRRQVHTRTGIKLTRSEAKKLFSRYDKDSTFTPPSTSVRTTPNRSYTLGHQIEA